MLLLCASVCAFVAGGCVERHAKAKPFPWSTFAYTRPLKPAEVTERVDDSDLLADVSIDVEPPPSALVLARAVPLRPRVASTPAASNEGSSKPDVPQIAPQLTPAETNAAQQQANQSVNVAERNLAAAEGRSLNATQKDLASKIRSFLSEARDAVQSGDWPRARNAAKKAEVLSQELASSLQG